MGVFMTLDQQTLKFTQKNKCPVNQDYFDFWNYYWKIAREKGFALLDIKTLQFYQKYDIDRKNQEISPCIKRNLIYNRIIIQLD